jgi:Tol biopolymer transport system component
VAGQYRDVENLGAPINTKYHEVDPFIAPNESYLIFCSEKPGGFGRADIYVTFRSKRGEWSEPVNMGENINSSHSEYIPYVTPDGRYFFFTSNKSGDRDIYWVDAKVVGDLNPNKQK